MLVSGHVQFQVLARHPSRSVKEAIWLQASGVPQRDWAGEADLESFNPRSWTGSARGEDKQKREEGRDKAESRDQDDKHWMHVWEGGEGVDQVTLSLQRTSSCGR